MPTTVSDAAAARNHASAFFGSRKRPECSLIWDGNRSRSRSCRVRVSPNVGAGVRGADILNNRHLDPATGTFLSVDPLVAETGFPYLYGDGNPVTFSDPSGLGTDEQGSCGGYVSQTACLQALQGAQNAAGAARYTPDAGAATATHERLTRDVDSLTSTLTSPSRLGANWVSCMHGSGGGCGSPPSTGVYSTQPMSNSLWAT